MRSRTDASFTIHLIYIIYLIITQLVPPPSLFIHLSFTLSTYPVAFFLTQSPHPLSYISLPYTVIIHDNTIYFLFLFSYIFPIIHQIIFIPLHIPPFLSRFVLYCRPVWLQARTPHPTRGEVSRWSVLKLNRFSGDR